MTRDLNCSLSTQTAVQITYSPLEDFLVYMYQKVGCQ